MRILFWNILHGGGPRRTPEILLAILEQEADIVALCEFRVERGSILRAALQDHGLVFQAISHASSRRNGMFLASRLPFKHVASTAHAGREIDIEHAGGYLTAVHIPDDAAQTRKAEHWNRLTSLARERRDSQHLLIGDLNTTRGLDAPRSPRFASTSHCAQRLGQLCSLGYKDLWPISESASEPASSPPWESYDARADPSVGVHMPAESYEHNERLSLRPRSPRDQRDAATWVDHGGTGRRIDAAYASAALAPRVERMSHLSHLRETGVSDHSPLLVAVRGET